YLDIVRRVFTDPESFRPDLTSEAITRETAERISIIAAGLRDRGHEPHAAAHFLMKCMFCLFAEDVGLLADGLFTRLLSQWRQNPDELAGVLTDLFATMRTGGAFGTERIDYFNGGLFDEAPALPLTDPEIGELLAAAGQDWSAVEPSIFGTLFERTLDPSKRAQIGAHYTSREDIMLVVEPVVMVPLRRRWDEVRDEVDAQLARRRKAKTDATKRKANAKISELLHAFMQELGAVRILDPACGSGNFLYVAIQQLLNLEKEVIAFAARPEVGGGGLFPNIRPTQLRGIEVNPYAAELAQVVIWIGYLQWMRDNGFVPPRDPILEPLQTIECRDAILAWTDPDDKPIPAWRQGARGTGQADWPQADFIIGNPPFLGSKVFREYNLPDAYIEAMYANYDIPNSSDLCCYWFERGREVVEQAAARKGTRYVRIGLLATQGIRGGANREVLKRIKDTGDIFLAWSDRRWILEGAAVHVSIVGFDDGDETERALDGKPVEQINTDLTGDLDLSGAVRLQENIGAAFMGDTKVGPFDIQWAQAKRLLEQPNPHGKPNSDVLRPWVNGSDITKRPRGMWIVDFPPGTPKDEASRYEAPFEYIAEHVRPMRKTARSGDATGVPWWIHQRARPDMRDALPSDGYLGTPNVTKFRIFVQLGGAVLPDHQLIVFARSDDYFFGVLHSSIHELWALRMGTQLESRPRYTPTTCFETFPLPWAPGREPEGDALHAAISTAAAELNAQRERWCNPPEWIEPIARRVDQREDFSDVPEAARALIRQSAIQAEAVGDKDLKKRTLTNLYNERPAWLQLAHAAVDRAVLAAYAAVDPEGGWDPDWAEVWQPCGAGRPLADDHPLTDRRARIEQRVLANLLRLNTARCEA
ncbi:MAG: class I SAM-dependent DNA methyltransferase, partial [Planctomycetota bacterium]